MYDTTDISRIVERIEDLESNVKDLQWERIELEKMIEKLENKINNMQYDINRLS